MICSVCNKNTAVVFLNKIENGKKTVEGLCYNCAKEKGINPLEVLAKNANITNEELEDMSNQFENILRDFSENMNLEALGITQEDFEAGNELIWATISNKGLEKQTNEIIKNYKTRTDLIDTLVNYISKYRVRGINIDFQDVVQQDGFARFIIELTPRLRELGRKCKIPKIVFKKILDMYIDKPIEFVFDEAHFAYLEDVDIGYRARIFGYYNYYEPKAIVYHAGSATSGSRYNEFKTRLAARNSIYLIYKNQTVLQWILHWPCILAGLLVKQLFFCRKGMGKIYFQSVLEGFSMSFSNEGKKHKVRFRMKNLGNYLRLELELWWNMVRKLFSYF